MEDLHRSLLRRHLEAGHITRRDLIKRIGAIGASAPVVASLLAACGGSASTPTSSTSGSAPTATSGPVTINENATPSGQAASPTAAALGKAGGSVTLIRGTDSNNLDMVEQDGNVNIWILDSVYDQLIKMGPDGLSLVPGLAEKWSASSDGTTFTFNIRQGVKFSDGSDMKVSDITWSLNRAMTTKDSPWLFTLQQVKTITAPDNSTVVITLSAPWAPFLADVSMFNASIYSQAFSEKVGVANLVSQTLGTGPFILKQWNKAQSMILTKNPNYWEQGLPLLDQITLNVVPDANSRVLQLKGGQADGIIGQNDIALNQVADLQSNPNLQVTDWPSTYVNFVVMNCRNAPLDDIPTRQALNYATDKDSIIKSVLFGHAAVSNSFMPNGALFWNKDQKGYPFDLTQAQNLMKQSKSPNGFDVEFQILGGNQLALQLATAIKAMWSKINVNVNISQLEQGVLHSNYVGNKFQLYLTGWTNDIIDPDELVSYAILPDASQAYHTGWSNQQAVDLANQGRATLDPAKRQQIYYQIQQIHMNDAPWVYLYVLPYIDAMNKKIKGYFHHPMGQWDFSKMSTS
ncbi:MAG TPA: ABC transporter substrate-binding protein [Thermomicrobiaceae bacterium]|nr:ABC transporter substrate-binding protein [Thermomicrobiaceae bacterium]